MVKKDWKILLIGILIGIILVLGILKSANALFSPVAPEEDLMSDDYSLEMMDEGDPTFEVRESTIEAEDIANP